MLRKMPFIFAKNKMPFIMILALSTFPNPIPDIVPYGKLLFQKSLSAYLHPIHCENAIVQCNFIISTSPPCHIKVKLCFFFLEVSY